MARKSRKNMMPQAAVQEAVQQNEKELLRTAAYVRLSVENGGHETEDSLHTQILQIHNYIRENPELTLTDTYADNGFTGTRFDRPEFERMMQDVRTGKIQCIVVKDLSRFGRDYIETGSYLETIFPMLHVRFIAINDDFDNIRQSDVDSLAVAPDSEMLWNAAIVWRILRRYEYTGALVMGRRKKIDVNTTSVRTLPEDKWIIAENAHAAIVTRDEYYQAQKAIRNVTPIQYKVGDEFALKGKICCGNCNRQLRHERQYGEMVFYCGYKRSAGKFSKCYGGYYREYSVNAKVVRAIKTVFYALDVVNQGMQEKQSITVRCVDIEDLEKQAEAIRVEQIKLYESYADGVLLRDAYIEKKKVLSEKLAVLQDSIRTEKEEQECADELDEEIRALTKQASEKTYIGGLTKECVDAFVSMVYLYDDQTMKIEFNCEDVIRRALEKYGA